MMNNALDVLLRARQVAQEANVKVVYDRRSEVIKFYFPSGRIIHVWFPQKGRTNDLHIKDLEEVVRLMEEGEIG